MATSAVSAERSVARLESLTSLRFVAAFLVFLNHATPYLAGDPLHRWFNQGVSGVSFFFILSGFVLTWSRSAGDTAIAFYRRRAARIYPVFVLALVACLVLSLRGFVAPGRPAGEWVATLFLVQAWVPRLSLSTSPLRVSWSLSCEVFFYAVFPLIIGPIVRSSSRVRAALAVAMLVVPFAAATAAHPHIYKQGWLWLHFACPPVRLAEFVLGILLALTVEAGRWPKVPVSLALGLAAAAFVAAGSVPYGFYAVATTLVPFCVLIGSVAARDAVGRAPRWLRAKWFVRLGAWSYAFYLIHDMILSWCMRIVSEHGHSGDRAVFVTAVAAFCLAVGGAAALYRYVEMPLERRLRGARPRSRADVTDPAIAR